MFDAPAAAGETLKPAEVNGHLLIVRPTSYEPNLTTSFGGKDAVRVNVVDLDAADYTTGEVGTLTTGALWFSGLLVGGLKSQIGKTILARMGQGVANPGQSAPWKLEDATGDPAAVQRAQAWMTANPGALDGLSAPPAATAPAAPAAPPAATTPPPAPPAAPTLTPEQQAALAQLSPEQLRALGMAG